MLKYSIYTHTKIKKTSFFYSFYVLFICLFNAIFFIFFSFCLRILKKCVYLHI